MGAHHCALVRRLCALTSHDRPRSWDSLDATSHTEAPKESEPSSPREQPVLSRALTPKLMMLGIIEYSSGQSPLKKYKCVSKIGEGGFATVRQAQDRKTKSIRAIKTQTKCTGVERIKLEVDIMKCVDHPNVIKLYEVFEDDRYVYMVMEYCDGGDMFDMLQRATDADGLRDFGEADVKVVMRQIFRGIHYINRRGIVHRDLKLENCLFQIKPGASSTSLAQCVLKIIDFGVACYWRSGDAPLTDMIGTADYLAPEILAHSYGVEVDAWSCGIVMYILLSGRFPFHGGTDAQMFRAIQKKSVKFGKEWCGVSDDAKSLILSMLEKDAALRCSAEEALAHPWLAASRVSIVSEAQPKLPSSMFQNLRAFQSAGRLKKASLHLIAQHLATAQIADVQTLFEKLDSNHGGTLTPQEISECVTNIASRSCLGKSFDLSLEDIRPDPACSRDGNCALPPSPASRGINYTEFLAASLDRRLYLQEAVCWEAFCTFDLDGTGKISPEELRQVLDSEEVSEMLGNQTVEAIIEEHDTNGDGYIDFGEFMNMMKKTEVDLHIGAPLIAQSEAGRKRRGSLSHSLSTLEALEPSSPESPSKPTGGRRSRRVLKKYWTSSAI